MRREYNREDLGAYRRGLYYERYSGKPLPPQKEKGGSMNILKLTEKLGESFGFWWFETAQESQGGYV